jgi:hypothetical protein
MPRRTATLRYIRTATNLFCFSDKEISRSIIGGKRRLNVKGKHRGEISSVFLLPLLFSDLFSLPFSRGGRGYRKVGKGFETRSC